MPQIIPIRDLKDTNKISERCRNTKEPIFITKNGYGDMVIMRMETYEEQLAMQEIYAKLAVAESQVKAGQTISAAESLRGLKEKYAL